MVFSCTGSTFTALSLDYTNNGQLIGTITANTTWNEYTKGKFHYNLGGKKYDVTFTLCDSLTSSSVACGYPGDIIVDMSGFAATYLGQDFSSSRMKTLITSAYIDFSAKPNGKTEHCKKQVLTSGSTDSSQLNAATNGSLIALAVVVIVGLAVFAAKRAKVSLRPAIEVKRIRLSRSSSNRSLRSRSRSMPRNDAEERLVDKEGEIV